MPNVNMLASEIKEVKIPEPPQGSIVDMIKNLLPQRFASKTVEQRFENDGFVELVGEEEVNLLRTIKMLLTPETEGVEFSLAVKKARLELLKNNNVPAGIVYISGWLPVSGSDGLYSLGKTVGSVGANGGILRDANGYHMMREYDANANGTIDEGEKYRIELSKNTLVLTADIIEEYLADSTIPEAVKEELRVIQEKMNNASQALPVILEANIPMLEMVQAALTNYGYVNVAGVGIQILDAAQLRA